MQVLAFVLALVAVSSAHQGCDWLRAGIAHPEQQLNGRKVGRPIGGGELCNSFSCPDDFVCIEYFGEPICIQKRTCDHVDCGPNHECIVYNNLAHCVPNESGECGAIECPEGLVCSVGSDGRGQCVEDLSARTTTTSRPALTRRLTAFQPPKQRETAEDQPRTCQTTKCGPGQTCEMIEERPRCVTACGNLNCESNHCQLLNGVPTCILCDLACPKRSSCKFVGPTRFTKSGSELPKQRRCVRDHGEYAGR